jgi:hypothetical protein
MECKCFHTTQYRKKVYTWNSVTSVTQHNSNNLAPMGPDKCRFIKYSRLSDDTLTYVLTSNFFLLHSENVYLSVIFIL